MIKTKTKKKNVVIKKKKKKLQGSKIIQYVNAPSQRFWHPLKFIEDFASKLLTGRHVSLFQQPRDQTVKIRHTKLFNSKSSQ